MKRFGQKLDESAIDELIARHLPSALAVATRLLHDRASAEDAVQEALLRIVRHRSQYDPDRPFTTWLYAILRNICMDVLRRRHRQRRAIEQASLLIREYVPPAAPASGEGDLLARLPRGERDVLSLRIVEDLPFRDVAAALGISEDAARKRAQRGLDRLRQTYAAGRSADLRS
ncbi:MAG: RNA polymerase sigma factor CarQ [Phycisphaerae bacterium]|nr:RNA polymerase sigma factor CarQ [Phycisphaerae bacterium]